MAEPDRRRAVPSELGVAALVIASAIPLGRLFRTGNIAAASFSAAAASTAVAWGLRRFRTPTILAAIASAAAFLWFASIAFFREATIGPFPTPESLGMIWDAFVEAARRSQTDVAPVAATDSFLCLASFGVWATAWLADDAAIKLRHPMLAIGVTVPLYVLPGTIVEATHRWADAGVYLGAALWVLFQDERFRLSRWGRVVGSGVPGWRPGLAARMALVAIALALVATPVLPGFGAPPGLRGVGGAGRRTVLNPLVTIKDRLGERRPSDLFTVHARTSAYWRLTALDRFDGFTWRSAGQRPDLRVSGRTIVPQNPASQTRVVQEIEISGLAGPWLPAAYEPVRVDDLGGVGADRTTRTLISPHDLRDGLKYTVTSRLPRLTYTELDLVPRAAGDDPALLPYLELPAGVHSDEIRRVGEIARSIADDAGATDDAPFRQAVALQKHLRTFTYDENVGARHSIDTVEQFLVSIKRGYCEQFATAMAVMARTLGLPSRVAIGFAGGSIGNEPDEVTVTTRSAHAWVEIFFAPYGWVQFEPTPRSDSLTVPSYTSPPAASPTTPETPATESPEPTPTDSPTTGRAAPEPELEGGVGTSLAGRLVPVGVAAGGLLVLLLIAFPLAARMRRWLRRRRARTASERIAARYLDFLDWCAAAGVGRAAAETPLEHARRLAGASTDTSEAGASVEELARGVVDAVYAPPNGADPEAIARLERSARTTVGATLSRRTRALSVLGWGWWRTDPSGRRWSRFSSTHPIASDAGPHRAPPGLRQGA